MIIVSFIFQLSMRPGGKRILIIALILSVVFTIQIITFRRELPIGIIRPVFSRELSFVVPGNHCNRGFLPYIIIGGGDFTVELSVNHLAIKQIRKIISGHNPRHFKGSGEPFFIRNSTNTPIRIIKIKIILGANQLTPIINPYIVYAPVFPIKSPLTIGDWHTLLIQPLFALSCSFCHELPIFMEYFTLSTQLVHYIRFDSPHFSA